MLNYEFHPEAMQEAFSSGEYYESKRLQLGLEFANQLHETIQLIRQFPEAFQTIYHDCRSCQLDRFPYCLIFHVLNDNIIILAVAHMHQKPSYWRDRAKWSPDTPL